MELKDSGQENVPLGGFEMEEGVGGTQKNLRTKKIIIYSRFKHSYCYRINNIFIYTFQSK